MSYDRPIKSCSNNKIEEAISNAISKLTDEKYKTEILSIDFAPKEFNNYYDVSELKIRIYQPMTSLDKWAKEEQEEETETTANQT